MGETQVDLKVLGEGRKAELGSQGCIDQSVRRRGLQPAGRP